MKASQSRLSVVQLHRRQQTVEGAAMRAAFGCRHESQHEMHDMNGDCVIVRLIHQQSQPPTQLCGPARYDKAHTGYLAVAGLGVVARWAVASAKSFALADVRF